MERAYSVLPTYYNRFRDRKRRSAGGLYHILLDSHDEKLGPQLSVGGQKGSPQLLFLLPTNYYSLLFFFSGPHGTSSSSLLLLSDERGGSRLPDRGGRKGGGTGVERPRRLPYRKLFPGEES